MLPPKRRIWRFTTWSWTRHWSCEILSHRITIPKTVLISQSSLFSEIDLVRLYEAEYLKEIEGGKLV